jgi:hypothetical protein
MARDKLKMTHLIKKFPRTLHNSKQLLPYSEYTVCYKLCNNMTVLFFSVY